MPTQTQQLRVGVAGLRSGGGLSDLYDQTTVFYGGLSDGEGFPLTELPDWGSYDFMN